MHANSSTQEKHALRRDNFLQSRCERVTTCWNLDVCYRPEVSIGDPQTIAPKKVGDTGIGGRFASRCGVELHAISIARGAREQNQRRL